MLKTALKKLIVDAARRAYPRQDVEVEVDTPKDAQFGDYTTNVALTLTKPLKSKPREIAEKIKVSLMDKDGLIESVSVAGAGFLNFRINQSKWIQSLKEISDLKEKFGICEEHKNQRALVEFVSANPTGPLHVGHGRNAVVGDTVARLLSAVGYKVEREYYVNDGGVQMSTLGRSVLARYKELLGEKVSFPEDGYQGEYIIDIAKNLVERKKDYSGLDDDKLIEDFAKKAGDEILENILKELKNLGVNIEHSFFESTLFNTKKVDSALKKLKKKKLSYESDGALWLKSEKFGDDKDRVLTKKDGAHTYLTPDIAYHVDKLKRGFDLLINVWGADHGGYGPRLKAAIKGLGYDPDKLKIILIQMVSLIRGGKAYSMSTRKAQFETLENVVKEVGSDVARYFFMLRSYQAQLDFDLDLAKKETNENPVYYIQYAHARICSIIRKGREEGKIIDEWPGYDENCPSLLNLPGEGDIAKKLLDYPELIKKAADELAPHRIAFYVLELARVFQSYYDKARGDERYRVLSGDEKTIKAKLFLLGCIRQVLRNALTILGVSTPEKM